MRAALWAVLLAGCTKPSTLVQLSSKVLFVSVSATGGLGVELQYDDSTQCLNIGDTVHASFNGESLELFTQGARSLGIAGDSCDFPLWESTSLDITPALASFTLSDSSATITGSFDNLFVDRGYMLTTATTATAGDTVALSWSPASDGYDTAKLQIIFAPATGTGAVVAQGTQISTANGVLSFVLPAGAPIGAGNLLVSGDANAHVASCVGAERCEATFEVASLIPFTVR